MATKKGFNLYFIDPVTGKRKLARTKEQNRIARQQQKEKLNKMKAEQKAIRQQGAIKLAKARKATNPKLYKDKVVSQSGKLYNREQRAKQIIEKHRLKKHKWSKQEQKDFKLWKLEQSHGKADQALTDLNTVGQYYNNIFGKLPSELKVLLNNSVGYVNKEFTYEDFYNEKYDEIMLPNMLKEINVYANKFINGLESLYDYAKGAYGDDLEKVEYTINEMKILIDMCKQSRTEYQRQILIAGEEEPEQPRNLHLSGM